VDSHPTLGLITARGGSKGIPGKNLRLLDGKPLIAWTIQAALRSDRIHRVLVSTDDPAILQAALDFGAEAPFLRPSEFARDNSPHIDCVLHALSWLQTEENYIPEGVCLLQPTSPFRTEYDIDAAISIFIDHDVEAVISVTESSEHPFFAQTITSEGLLAPFLQRPSAYDRRQDLPASYHVNGAIYMNRTESLSKRKTFYPPNIRPYIMPPQRALDINTPWDLHMAELIARNSPRSTP